MIKRSLVVVLLVLAINPSASAAPIYIFPVANCEVTYDRAHHDYPANDILAKAGCRFVSPINGIVDEVNRVDEWVYKTNRGQDRGGLYVSIIGSDGVRYYGSHLRTVAKGIEPGVSVKAGQILGQIGATGSARGTSPHLHFGISWPTKVEDGAWWVRRGILSPYEYLNAWKLGKDKSPAASLAVKKAKLGDLPPAPKK
jgi:murein DD-endopeptidase MepM/ murein hydrolase activator NlpD